MSRLLPVTRQRPPLDTSIPCFKTQPAANLPELTQLTDQLADPGSAQQEATAPVNFVDRNAGVGQITMPIPDRRDDPDLVHFGDCCEKQLADPGYVRWTTTTNVDLDEHGILLHLLPSGEWLPIQAMEGHPITVFMTNDAHEDARLLRSEEVPGKTVLSEEFLRFPLGNLVATTPSPDPAAIQLDEFLREQAADAECRQWLTTAKADTPFDIDETGVLIRIAPLDKSRKIVVPATVQPRLLHLEHYPQTAGHPGVSRMIRSISRRFFWPRMAADVTETVRSCTTCAKNRIKERTRTSVLKLFPASVPLEYVAIDILGPLPRTSHGNMFLLVMTDRF
jgi:Integrase zinc binding domain